MKKTRRKKETKIKHKSELKKEIGLRFKRFRQSLGKNQKQLADELQLYQTTITNIEVGKTFPGTAYIRPYMLHFDYSLVWMNTISNSIWN